MLANESIKTRQLPDKSLLFAILAMIMFGWIMSFSASLAHFNSHNWFIKQTIFISTGLILGLLVLKIPISLFKKVSVPLFILTLILLAMVFLPSPIGVNVNGSYRWISFGFFNFQPSELMKLAMILYMAGFLIRQEKDVRRPWMGFLKTILIVSAADILLLLEMDIGATLIITLTAIAMLFAAGSYLTQLGIVVCAFIGVVFIFIINDPTRLYRLTSYLHDPSQVHQTWQALIGIARGGWFGTGLGGGIQKYSLLPEPQTDMIFAVIGEELGILGMLFVLLSYTYILGKGFNIAKIALKKGRKYSSFVAFGICTWFAMQITVNIGMNLGLLPPKGFTLPLLSYGGTSIIFSIISLAILMRVDMESRTGYAKQREYV
jgi:cell division protein FtsW